MKTLTFFLFTIFVFSFTYSQLDLDEITNIQFPSGSEYLGKQIADIDNDGHTEVYVCFLHEDNSTLYLSQLDEFGSIQMESSFDYDDEHLINWEVLSYYQEKYIMLEAKSLGNPFTASVNFYHFDTGQNFGNITLPDVTTTKSMPFKHNGSLYCMVSAGSEEIVGQTDNFYNLYTDIYVYSAPDFETIDSTRLFIGFNGLNDDNQSIRFDQHIIAVNHYDFEGNAIIQVGIETDSTLINIDYFWEEVTKLYSFSFDGISISNLPKIDRAGLSFVNIDDFIISPGTFSKGRGYSMPSSSTKTKVFYYNLIPKSLAWDYIPLQWVSGREYMDHDGYISYENYPFKEALFVPNSQYTNNLGLVTTYTEKDGYEYSGEHFTKITAFTPDFDDTLWTMVDSVESPIFFPMIYNTTAGDEIFLTLYGTQDTCRYLKANPANGEIFDTGFSSIVPSDVCFVANNDNWIFDANENELVIYIHPYSIGIHDSQKASSKPTPTLSNHPNPFNPTTTISFDLAQEEEVTLSIYNIKGQLVRTLINNENLEMGAHSVVWNGTNSSGKAVGSGIYYYKLQAGNVEQVEKMVLMK